MGQVESNVGWGRVRAASGWVIEAWYGNGALNEHTAYRFGALVESNIAMYRSASAVAYNSGKAAWLTACGANFATWYYTVPNDSIRELLFDAAREAGAQGWDP